MDVKKDNLNFSEICTVMIFLQIRNCDMVALTNKAAKYKTQELIYLTFSSSKIYYEVQYT
jgi:hypothetical protein